MPSTIRQVARKAGVSKATVSRVINNSKPVREATRMRVLQAIKELDFKPNPAARSLVYKKSGTLGVIVTDSANLFVSVLVKGIEEIAYRKGYNLFICNSHASPEKEVELLMMLKDKRVDGIIFLTSQLMPGHKKFFSDSSLPITLVNVGCDESNAICISIDNRRASYDMTRYFLEKGYTRVGMIRGQLEDEYTGKERYLGYCQALDDFNLPLNESLVWVGSLEASDGYKIAREIIKNNIKLDALLVACDLMAFGAIKAFLNNGLRVPEDIEVAGFDDVPMASYYHPSLTTVRQPITDMGRMAARKLIKLIEGEQIEQYQIILPHELVIRDSTTRNKKE